MEGWDNGVSYKCATVVNAGGKTDSPFFKFLPIYVDPTPWPKHGLPTHIALSRKQTANPVYNGSVRVA